MVNQIAFPKTIFHNHNRFILEFNRFETDSTDSKYEIFGSRFLQRPEEHWNFEKDKIVTVGQLPLQNLRFGKV